MLINRAYAPREVKTLDEALAEARTMPDPLYRTKKEVSEPGWEGAWERVLRMREEGHWLIKGGNYRDTSISPVQHLRMIKQRNRYRNNLYGKYGKKEKR